MMSIDEVIVIDGVNMSHSDDCMVHIKVQGPRIFKRLKSVGVKSLNTFEYCPYVLTGPANSTLLKAASQNTITSAYTTIQPQI